MKLKMGLYDYPQEQKQPEFEMDYFLSNIAVLGGVLSGKTTFVKSLLVQITRAVMQYDYKENIYIIDFGGNLGDYADLPNVRACFNGRNEEDVRRVFKTIDIELEKKVDKLKNMNFNRFFEENPDECPAHTTLIIENLNSFLSDERYADYQDKIHQLCRDGISKGLTVVISANETNGIGRLLPSFAQKVAFDIPSDSYYEIFNTKVLKPIKTPGRGLINKDSSVFEFQCILPFAKEESTSLNQLIEKAGEQIESSKLLSFPYVLTSENFDEYLDKAYETNKDDIVVGLEYYQHEPVSIDISRDHAIAIYGKRQFGKSNLLRVIFNKLKEKKFTRFVFLDDGREELKEFYDGSEEGLSHFYHTSVEDFRNFLADYGYGGTYSSSHPLKGKSGTLEETPFTVFVMQSKMLFLANTDSKRLMETIIPEMISNAEKRNYLFIFSDVRKFSGDMSHTRMSFNNSISIAFLLDNIADFVFGRGQDTVFGDMDPVELKAEYAKCSIGDGYFYDVAADKHKKVKFIYKEKPQQ